MSVLGASAGVALCPSRVNILAEMNYSTGEKVLVGDRVKIGPNQYGVVVCSIDGNELYGCVSGVVLGFP